VGAWGTGVFEDDGAMDWIAVLASSATIIPLVESLRAADAEDHLPASACSAALAAAEVIAALSGRPGADLPRPAADWVRAHPLQVNEPLLQLALAAVHRIETASELRDLWDESDEYAEWQSRIKDLVSRLSAA
jgi:hypothetical protein